MLDEHPISRQRAWQLRQQEAGKCIKCGAPLASRSLCKEHLIMQREWSRKRSNAKKVYRCFSRRLEQEQSPHHD